VARTQAKKIAFLVAGYKQRDCIVFSTVHCASDRRRESAAAAESSHKWSFPAIASHIFNKTPVEPAEWIRTLAPYLRHN
jgi:hypothetical protein